MMSPQGMSGPLGPQPKTGPSALMIVLIVIGVVFVLGVGTCMVGAYFVGREAKKVTEGLADGGLVLVSPPEVQAALEGEKKDYVGMWQGANGDFIEIKQDGTMNTELHDGGTKEKFTNIAIAAFQGDDIEIRPVIKLVIKVNERPHKVSDHWEMKVRGTTFKR